MPSTGLGSQTKWIRNSEPVLTAGKTKTEFRSWILAGAAGWVPFLQVAVQGADPLTFPQPGMG